MSNTYQIQACNIANNYVLLPTINGVVTHPWSRADTSGRQVCNCDTSGCEPLIRAKLKYYVLKNTNSTVPNSGTLGLKSYSSGLKNTIPNSNTILVGNIQYQIPCDFLNYLDEIKQRLMNGENITNILLDISKKYNIILLKNVPLSQYKPRYTYKAGGNVPLYQYTPQPNYVAGKNIPSHYNNVRIRHSMIINDRIDSRLSNVPIYIKEFIEYIKPILGNNYFIVPDNVYTVSICNNDGKTFTTNIIDLYPGQSASFLGSKVLSKERLNNFFQRKILNNADYDSFLYVNPINNTKYGGTQYNSVGFFRYKRNVGFVYIPFYTKRIGFTTKPYAINTPTEIVASDNFDNTVSYITDIYPSSSYNCAQTLDNVLG